MGKKNVYSIVGFCFVIVLSVFLMSCYSNDPKNYTYTLIETRNHGNDTIVDFSMNVKANSDSVALINAYWKYFVSERAYYDRLLENLASRNSFEVPKPIHFTLVGEDGHDISNLQLEGLALILDSLAIEAKEKKELYLYALNQRIKNDSIKEFTTRDLRRYFNHRKDEFRDGDFVWVEPKNAPSYIDVNGIYCYFCIRNGQAQNFRMKIQYAASNWLFIKSYTFNIDGSIFNITPSKIERNNNSTIWEWSDNNLKSSDIIMLEKFASCKVARVQFVGKQHSKNRNLSKSEITSIKRAYEYYKALGGDF